MLARNVIFKLDNLVKKLDECIPVLKVLVVVHYTDKAYNPG
jgi:hypothetical protein